MAQEDSTFSSENNTGASFLFDEAESKSSFPLASVDSTNTTSQVSDETTEQSSPDTTTQETTESTTESDDFVNPFLNGTTVEITEEESTTDTTTTVEAENPFLKEIEDEEVQMDENEVGTDILIDLGVGGNIPKIIVQGTGHKTVSQGRVNIVVEPGIIIPFKKHFFVGIYGRYLQLSYSLKESRVEDGAGGLEKIEYESDSREDISFITLPIRIGGKYAFGKITPYIYGNFETSYLVSAHQYAIASQSQYYKNGTIYRFGVTSDLNMKVNRDEKIDKSNFTFFAGGGGGIEIAYGYGLVYLDAGLQVQLNDNVGNLSVEITKRDKIRAIYMPFSIGVRFFL